MPKLKIRIRAWTEGEKGVEKGGSYGGLAFDEPWCSDGGAGGVGGQSGPAAGASRRGGPAGVRRRGEGQGHPHRPGCGGALRGSGRKPGGNGGGADHVPPCSHHPAGGRRPSGCPVHGPGAGAPTAGGGGWCFAGGDLPGGCGQMPGLPSGDPAGLGGNLPGGSAGGRVKHFKNPQKAAHVGLSNILDSDLGGRHPAERPHG